MRSSFSSDGGATVVVAEPPAAPAALLFPLPAGLPQAGRPVMVSLRWARVGRGSAAGPGLPEPDRLEDWRGELPALSADWVRLG